LQSALLQSAECTDITPKARKGLFELGEMLDALRTVADDASVSGLIDSLIRRTNYMQYLDDGTPQGEARQENVRELLSVAQEYQDVGLEGFVEEVALVSDIDSADFAGNAVTLMTLHAAKGLEFPVVFMIGMEETVLPHSRALYDQSEMEEERRLCYVGMTRARQELYLTYASGRLLYGGVQHNPPSRFISEIGVDSVSTANENQYFGQPSPPQPSWYGGNQAEPENTKWGDIGQPNPQDVRYVPDLVEGDGVRHPIFGAGTVLEIDGDNAVIYFRGKGSKKLNISFAPLEKI
jgi:DNA helicase-2/ATP-dependent DNA helicase PcrA